jgi:hypothetical protein
MHFRNGLALLTRTNVRTSWNLASFHSPHSMTWRWLLSFSLFRADEGRWWPIWMPYRANNGLQWVIRIPLVGFLRFAQQRPMWYRDCYQRLRDQRDGLLPDDDRPLPHQMKPTLTVIDGGNSIH